MESGVLGPWAAECCYPTQEEKSSSHAQFAQSPDFGIGPPDDSNGAFTNPAKIPSRARDLVDSPVKRLAIMQVESCDAGRQELMRRDL